MVSEFSESTTENSAADERPENTDAVASAEVETIATEAEPAETAELGTNAAAEADAPQETAGEQPEAAEPQPTQPELTEPQPTQPELILPLSDMTPEERFRATTRLIFLAPDVPPVQPRQRRSDLRQLDDILDRQFSRSTHHSRDDHREPGRSRDGRDARDSRDRRDNFTHRDGDDHSDEADTGAARRRRRTSNGSVSDSHADSEGRRSGVQTAPVTEPQKVRGSTRLEAKKQRRREGREAGRRRRTVITESEFLARRESVERDMIVRTTADRVQIGVLEDKVLVEHYVARSSESSLIGNVYLGRVQNVLPSMEAAFVDIGRGRNAVLYSGEVDWSEYDGSASSRRIENALKPGDLVLVQVTKDPVGHKGARLTSQISLPGRFLVYVPGGAMNGISRKLPDTERARLKKILKEVLPSGAGVIVRTAAEGATEEQVKGDVERLTRQWQSIQDRVAKGSGPALLHSEPDMLIKIVRDVFNEDFHRLTISGAQTYQTIENYLSQVAPELLERVSHYEEERDIFDEYRITEQIAKALDRKVWLPSGGSLVIDRTEAMTVVDVNTGKFVGSGGNLEETVTKNNLEAAEEIVRQLRLRDIGGIIVIDFIDMVLESNRDLVLRRVIECLSRDRTKHQVAEVTSLGLVQMTRKKLGLGLLESFSEPCEVCAGRGVIVHHEPVAKHQQPNSSNRSNTRRSKNSNSNQSQANAITEKSRTMLAQIAAKTIATPADEQTGESEAVQDSLQSEPQTAASGTTESRAASRDSALPAQASTVAQPTQNAIETEDLLASVLQALPEPSPTGSRKRTHRRVSSAPKSAPLAVSNDESGDTATE